MYVLLFSYLFFQTGKWQDLDDASECKDCATGKINLATGSTTIDACSFCSAGKKFVSATEVCTDCGPGFYQDQNDASSVACMACSIGMYNDELGQSICKDDCTAGSYITSDKTACEQCTAGKWQDLDDTSECKECTVGMFNNLLGQAICQACLAGTCKSYMMCRVSF